MNFLNVFAKGIFLISGLVWILNTACTRMTSNSSKKEGEKVLQASSIAFSKPIDTTKSINTMIDLRDREMYAIATIGKQIWMAENLRFDAPGSKINPDNSSEKYGRLYDGKTVQTICPAGWHLPSDNEWTEMELVLGMSADEASNTFWRGEHGEKMKSVEGWRENEKGTNSSGFNGLPAGYWAPDTWGDANGFGGLGSSVGYWASAAVFKVSIMEENENRVWLRFLGGPLKGVNRFDADMSDKLAVACRCVKD